MTSVIDSMKAARKQMDDQSIAMDLLAGTKAATSAYYMATLESPTPELRSMFKASLNQTLDEYSVLMDLSLNRGWIQPYGMPEQQLAESYKQSQTVISYHKE
ncbi:MAG: hypothetical protein APF77_07760 [Clostridia bacterium BRH_c25]|nr:MAG: hypothetical protein APF77_07760 [Clostridia bacterium BRH_c25]